MLADHRRVLAPVARVHVLQHALPLAVREVDVDVRRLAPLLAQETLEEELERDGVDGGDAEAVADGAVRCRAAPLAEDPLTPREPHDVPDDQEVAGEPESRDERELVRELPVVARGAACAPALGRPRLDELGEVRVLADARREREVREPRPQRLEPEGAALGDRARGVEPGLAPAPSRRELGASLEVPLGVRSQPCSHLVERRAVAQRAEHVVRTPLLRRGVVHVIGDDPRDTDLRGEWNQFAHEGALFRECVVPAFDRDAPTEGVGERPSRLARRACGDVRRKPPVGAEGEESRHPAARASAQGEQPVCVRRELVERDARLAARMVETRPRDQCAEMAPSLPRLREADEMGAETRDLVLAAHHTRNHPRAFESWRQRHVDGEFGAENPRKSRGPRGGREAHRPAEVVVVGEREGGEPERLRARDEGLWR